MDSILNNTYAICEFQQSPDLEKIFIEHIKPNTENTLLTHFDSIHPQTNCENLTINNREGVEHVKSVKSVKNCGQCANFRGPMCESEAWEERNGNAQPQTNWCFKPKKDEGAF